MLIFQLIFHMSLQTLYLKNWKFSYPSKEVHYTILAFLSEKPEELLQNKLKIETSQFHQNVQTSKLSKLLNIFPFVTFQYFLSFFNLNKLQVNCPMHHDIT